MDAKFQVFISDFIAEDPLLEKSVLSDIAEVTALNALSEAELVGKIEESDAIMLYHCFNLTRQSIDRLKHCKVIVRCGVGYDNVDYVYARERGIMVANVPDYGSEEVADSAIGMTLALCRGIALFNARLKRTSEPWSYTPAVPLHRLRGRVFGVLGLGRIGTAAAIRAKALGMDVVFYDPYKPDGYDKAVGIRRAESLEEFLGQCSVVSLHCPLTPETRQIINAETLGLMPHGSYLINTARGDCVDLTAIPAAIHSGRLAGAGIDVMPIEPPPEDHPLLTAWRNPADPCAERVILNPHTAFYSEEGLKDMRVKGAQTCRKALLGEHLRNVVN